MNSVERKIYAEKRFRVFQGTTQEQIDGVLSVSDTLKRYGLQLSVNEFGQLMVLTRYGRKPIACTGLGLS